MFCEGVAHNTRECIGLAHLFAELHLKTAKSKQSVSARLVLWILSQIRWIHGPSTTSYEWLGSAVGTGRMVTSDPSTYQGVFMSQGYEQGVDQQPHGGDERDNEFNQ
jgi:hypothetical protein